MKTSGFHRLCLFFYPLKNTGEKEELYGSPGGRRIGCCTATIINSGKIRGEWCDHGWWEFDLDTYSASLSADISISWSKTAGRTRKNKEKRHIVMRTQGQAMLSDNIFCANCGGWLATIQYTDSYEKADSSIYHVDQVKYSCYHKSRKFCLCDGQTTYRAEKVDWMVSQTIREIFKSMSGAPEEEKIQDLFQRRIADNRAMQKRLNFELGKTGNSSQNTDGNC